MPNCAFLIKNTHQIDFLHISHVYFLKKIPKLHLTKKKNNVFFEKILVIIVYSMI